LTNLEKEVTCKSCLWAILGYTLRIGKVKEVNFNDKRS